MFTQAYNNATCIQYALTEAKKANDPRRIRALDWLVRNRTKWTCQNAQGSKEKRNVDIAIHFDEVADAYMALGHKGHQWRERAFRRHASWLRKYPIELVYSHQIKWETMTASEKKGATDKMCGYTEEVLNTGTFARKEILMAGENGERLRVLEELMDIWGVGKVKAEAMYGSGIKSVQDVRDRVEQEKEEAENTMKSGSGGSTGNGSGGDSSLSSSFHSSLPSSEPCNFMGTSSSSMLAKKPFLTRSQLIGLKHYDDLLTRIQRDEVEHITSIVRKACHAIAGHDRILVKACGSYRRGNASSGDVDVLISGKREGCGCGFSVVAKKMLSSQQVAWSHCVFCFWSTISSCPQTQPPKAISTFGPCSNICTKWTTF